MLRRRNLFALVCIFICAGRVFALSDDVRQRAARVVERVNLYRRLSGLVPIVLDEALSDGCVAHAKYLDMNPEAIKSKSLDVHVEDPAKPGYTPDGALAGATSDVTFFTGKGDAISHSIEFDYNSLYHRTPVLAAGLVSIGYGDSVGGKSGFDISLIRFGAYGNDSFAGIQLTPPPGSAGIRVSGGGFEIPSPTPHFGVKSGNPITAYFYNGLDSVQWVGSTVTAAPLGKKSAGKAKAILHDVIAPNKLPDQAQFVGNLISLIARKPLPKKSLISVEIQYTQGGVAKTVAWSFSTSAKGAFDPVAALASAPPQLDSAPVAIPPFVAPGKTVQFNVAASDSTSVAYAWDFGDGTNAAGASVSHVYTAKGTYNVTLTVTGGSGNSLLRTLTVTVQ